MMLRQIFNTGTTKNLIIATLVAILTFGIILVPILNTPGVDALSGSQFKADRIIDDAVFFNPNTMTVSQIQNFLDSKVPVCETNHAETSSSNDSGRPYICLKDYKQTTTNIAPESGLCNGYAGASNETSATIIYKVSKSCGINPQVLLVMLQKEQSLITDTWPWDIQYEKAMGAFCPDTAPCDPEYSGFFYQVYYGAHRFKVYKANPDSFNYKAGRNNTILYHPNTSCGSSNVFIQNVATALLYIYTPYQPNQAALNDLYGNGDLANPAPPNCSSFGNRNFWRLFNDWFGSTHYYSYAAEMIENKLYTDAARTTEFNPASNIKSGTTLYATIKAKNAGGITWKNSFVRIGTRSPQNHPSVLAHSSWISDARPAALKESSVVPGQIGTFEFKFTTPLADKTYIDQFQIVAEGRKWMDYNSRFDISVNVRNAYNAQILEKRAYADNGFTQKIGNTVKIGDKIYWRLRAKNIGTSSWSNTRVKVGTASPFNRPSELQDATWPSASRPTLLKEPSVAPGGIGTFEYATMGAGAEEIQKETFSLVAESVAWMPNAVYADNIKITNTLDRLLRGSLLVVGTDLRSGGYRLVMQGDGNLVVYNSSGKAVWNLGVAGGNRLVMQGDGNLVVYNSSGKAVWSPGVAGGNRLILQGDGNLVLYNSSNKPVWSSGSN
jgi:hypothetical protein